MAARIIPNEVEFAAIYNSLKRYPLLQDVADFFGVSRKTVINRAGILRVLWEHDGLGTKLIDRARERLNETVEEEVPEVTPQEHAHVRARRLKFEITGLLQRSRHPIINPDAVTVDSYISERYKRSTGTYVTREGTPRTWLTDTLRVAPIVDCRSRKFLFTGAQNDAPVHEGFWENLQAYAAHIGAEIIVGPWTYETQWWSENNPTSRAYDTVLTPHLCFGQLEVGDNFVFCGEMNTLPTAARPISDLTTYSRGRWAVFPHAKLQLESIPSTDPTVQAHQVMTSGAVTRPKVIARKAGSKSIFHHVIGATMVEFDDEGDIFCRQINASEDGSFYDLDVFVSAGEIETDHSVKAIVYADLHHAKSCPRNVRASFGVDIKTETWVGGSMLDALNPEFALIHDGHDQEYGNHHRAGDGHASFELAARGRVSVQREIGALGAFEILLRRPGLTIVNVESNHDLALDRYIKEGRYRNDGINLRFGLLLESAMVEYREKVADALENYEEPGNFSLLEFAMRHLYGKALDHVVWAYDGESFLIDGIECGHHGFRGANGSKATVMGYARMGRKMSIGDKHSPSINDGVYGAGAMALRQGYNRGPSGWATTHIIHYKNGKRSLVTLQKGKWRA